MKTPTSLHCYRPEQPASDCDATLHDRLKDSLKILQQDSRAAYKLARQYRRERRRIGAQEELEETAEEIRQAIREIGGVRS